MGPLLLKVIKSRYMEFVVSCGIWAVVAARGVATYGICYGCLRAAPLPDNAVLVLHAQKA
jgi:hypothetical protein